MFVGQYVVIYSMVQKRSNNVGKWNSKQIISVLSVIDKYSVVQFSDTQIFGWNNETFNFVDHIDVCRS